MSWASVASALARAERDPGSSVTGAKRNIDSGGHPSCRSWIPGLAALARDTSVRRRGARSEPLAVTVFTMSNSAVLFVPAARCCARVGLYPFAPDPKRGGRSADRRTILLSRLRDATIRASEARRVP